MPAKRVEREIPDEWRESVAEHLAAWVDRQPKGRRTSRALAPLLGVSPFTYGKLKKKEGPLGLHVLVQLRKVLKVSLDDLLGLAPLGASALSAEELEKVRALLRAERERDGERRPAGPMNKDKRT